MLEKQETTIRARRKINGRMRLIWKARSTARGGVLVITPDATQDDVTDILAALPQMIRDTASMKGTEE